MSHYFAAGLHFLLGNVSASITEAKGLTGWGSIRWMDLPHGMHKAKKDNKIMMAVIQKDGCSATYQLRQAFQSSQEIQELSRQFVMVNITAEEVAGKAKFQPDGEYTPRILFFDPDGRLMPLVKRDPRTKRLRYTYLSEKPVVTAMKRVLKEPEKYIKRTKYPEFLI